MANPFFVQPAQYGQALSGLAGSVQQFGQQRQEEQRRQEAEAYKQEAKQAMSTAFQSGDPMAIRQAVIQYPEIAETATQMFGFTNEQTEKVARETYRRALSETDPARRAAIMEGGIETVRQFGGSPRNMASDLEMLRTNPEGFDRSARAGYAALASDKEFEAMFPEAQKTTDPAAVREYEYFRGLSPEEQEQYQAVKRGTKTVNIGGVEYLPMPDGTLRPLTIDTGEGQQQVTPETTAATEATITRETERAKQEVKAGSPDAVREREEAKGAARMNVASTQDIVNQADNILTNESFIDSLTGTRGVLPAVPGTSGFDATIALDRLKNSLTLGNLDKMSGVLSESDIKILASEAGGLEPGMSRKAMIDRLNQIRSVFQSKTEEERRKLSKMMAEGSSGEGSEQNQSIDDLINKYAD